MMALPDDQLEEAWVRKAVVYLGDVVESTWIEMMTAPKFEEQKVAYTYGNLCHALAGLRRWTNRIEKLSH
jgi:hypothetical protein